MHGLDSSHHAPVTQRGVRQIFPVSTNNLHLQQQHSVRRSGQQLQRCSSQSVALLQPSLAPAQTPPQLTLLSGIRGSELRPVWLPQTTHSCPQNSCWWSEGRNCLQLTAERRGPWGLGYGIWGFDIKSTWDSNISQKYILNRDVLVNQHRKQG